MTIHEGFNVVFIGYFPGFGGAERSLIMTANYLSRMGNKVTIIALKDNNVVYEIDENVEYVFIPDNGNGTLSVQINRFLSLKKKLTRSKPDVVISFWLQTAIFASILSKRLVFKNVYSERGDPTDKEYKGVIGLLRSIFFRFVDGFVFQTEGAKQCFPKYVQDKGVVINNPVYIKDGQYTIPQKRRKVIVNVGRLHEQKNQKLLIDSFAVISGIFSEYSLEIYGDGKLRDELKRYITIIGLEGRVLLKGTTKNLFTQIQDASLFVLSSDYEGMPNALMEAMAIGLPCISTDCKPGGARELIANHENGIVVKTGSIYELSNAMKFMLEHPMDANLMGKKAMDICVSHSAQRIFLLWNEYLKKLIGEI